MARFDEEGFVAIYHRGSARYDLVRREYFDPLRRALLAGEPFAEAVGLYGARLVVRLDDVVGLSDEDAEGYRESRADADADADYRRKDWS